MLWAPREANTTRDRYWVRVTSSPASAKERAAIATSTRLALRTASTIALVQRGSDSDSLIHIATIV
jgi:hypothetical protein